MSRGTALHPQLPLWLAVVLACGLVHGCREQRPTPRQEQLERPSPAELPPASPPPPADRAEGEAPATGGHGDASGGSPGEGTYLPPSEQGAEVEITEVPLDATRSAPAAGTDAAATPPRAPQAEGPKAAGTGGAVPGGGTRPIKETASSPPPGIQGATSQTPPAALPGAEQLQTTAPRTRAEQAAALESELARKLQHFDQMMKQAEHNAPDLPATGGSAQGTPDGAGGLAAPPPGGPGAGGAAGEATGLGQTPDLSGQASGAHPPSPGRPSLAPAEIADEDIVARQLREAAEREADPALREKLWLEYRHYRDGL